MREIKFIENLSLEIENEESSVITVKTKGTINSQNSYALQNELLKLLKEEVFIIFDCKELTYITSSGIGSLLFIKNKIKKMNGDIFLTNPQAKVSSVLSSMGVSDILYEYSEILNKIKRE